LAWRVEISQTAEKQIAKLDPPIQTRIVKFLRDRLESAADPRRIGKALHGEEEPLWRYRVGDYRIICQIRDRESGVKVLVVGHRKGIYR
jgi:mRNA interferase RelE/StbE